MGEGVDHQVADSEYLEARSLRRTAGPVLLWGLGVGYVISGSYFGWNFGLGAGGWGGLLIATALMATLYTAMIFSIAELATAMPVAGGGYAFARRALGPWGGFAAGLAVTIEFIVAPAVIATGIGGYVAGMFAEPLPGMALWVPIVAYVIFVGINLLGARESLVVLLVITGLAVAALVIWGAVMVPSFEAENLFAIAPQAGESAFLPFGAAGIVAALPAASWFYLAIEGVPLAAEETANPSRDLPRGMIAAMLSLVALSLISLFLAAGVAGSDVVATSLNPLPDAAAAATGGRSWVFWLTTVVGLVGLIASFFSIIYAYSRQIFALSRAGYLPRWLSRTNRRQAPHWALIVPAVVGYGLIWGVDALNVSETVATPDLLMQMAVFAALVSYVMMMVSHLVLRRREPEMARPYRTPLYPVTPVVALVLALVALVSSLFYTQAALSAVLGVVCVFALGMAYFGLYSRHRLVASAPEEEFALVAQAERELGG